MSVSVSLYPIGTKQGLMKITAPMCVFSIASGVVCDQGYMLNSSQCFFVS